MGDAPELYTIPEAAKVLRCSVRSVEKYIREGLLPSFRIGRRRLITADALNAFIAQYAEGCA